jgi:poly(A) polymerase Pap1
MCASQNVTTSTQMIMTEELKKGADIVDKIIAGIAQWSELFEKLEFFRKYRYYIQVTASSRSAAVQGQWYAFAPVNLDDSLYYLVPFTGRELSSLEYGN